jgi:hypothetical protein
MSKPTRFAAEQWVQEGRPAPDPWLLADLIQSLGARVEALEADQLEQAESTKFCVDAIVRRVEALELVGRIQSGTLTPAEQAELSVVPVVDLEAAVHCAAAEARDAVMAKLHAPTAEARPAELVEMLAVLITSAATSRGAAENVLRRVAAWLRTRTGGWSGDCAVAADVLEQEAERG